MRKTPLKLRYQIPTSSPSSSDQSSEHPEVQAIQDFSKDQFSQKTTIEDFEILQKLGDGSYATVFLVRRTKDKKLYALKKA